MKYEILQKMFEGENPKSILEVGCAYGGLLADLDETFNFEKIGGIDSNALAIPASQERFPEHKDSFIQYDINYPFPIPDKSYDIVFSCGVLLYIVNPVFAIREMLRVGKKVIIAEPHLEISDDVGVIVRVDMTEGKTHHAIARDYKKFFDKYKIPYIYKDSGLGKGIFKCQLQE